MDSLFSERKYKEEYAKLGDERVQQGTKEYVVISKRKGVKVDDQTRANAKDAERFWFTRADLQWSEIPMKKMFSRKERKVIYRALVTQILVYLAPTSAFNPHSVWTRMKNEKLAILDSKEDTDTKKLSRAELIKRQNTDNAIKEKCVSEVTRIRNMKYDKNELITLLKELKTKIAKDAILIELLKRAMDEKNLIEILDILWAIERQPLSSEPTPPPLKANDIFKTNRDPSLVYDDINKVEKLLILAKNKRAEVDDIIKFQLDEMSDRLPPLTPYTSEFKLDTWQIRALEFIDAGKSLVICAPTSSGKTVLSTYVAMVSSHRVQNTTSTTTTTTGVMKTIKKNDKRVEVIDGEEVDIQDDDDGDDDDDEDEDSDDDDDDSDIDEENNMKLVKELSPEMIHTDRLKRLYFRLQNPDGLTRVLFVVPSEPLVWQVAAFFVKLLKDDNDDESKVAIVTPQMTYFPPRKFNVMPPIVVGTPMALESALTKPRGLVGRFETIHKAQGDLLPGGYDHFDWVIYDEVHAIDNQEGDALQRLIRGMNCKFLALSATVGNAEELRSWMERVKGDQLIGVETINVLPSESSFYGLNETVKRERVAEQKKIVDALIQEVVSTFESTSETVTSGGKDNKKDKKKGKQTSATDKTSTTNTTTTTISSNLSLTVTSMPNTTPSVNITLTDINSTMTVSQIKYLVWKKLPISDRDSDPAFVALSYESKLLINNDSTLESLQIGNNSVLTLITMDIQIIRSVDNVSVMLHHISPLSSVTSLRNKLVGLSDSNWNMLTADALQCYYLSPMSNTNTNTTTTTTSMSSYTVSTAIQAGDSQIHFTIPTTTTTTTDTTTNIAETLKRGTSILLKSNSVSNATTTQADVVTIATIEIKDTQVTIITQQKIFHSYDVGSTCTPCVSKDLSNHDASLYSYGLYSDPSADTSSTPTPTPTTIPVIQVRTLVNMISHQGRFINLQRYLWNDNKLSPMSPLAAVQSVEDLKSGILKTSNLSFTSKDCYRVWKELERIYPMDAIQQFNPTSYFNIVERITLQQMKEYEDLLKSGLQALAQNYPLETQELLNVFRLQDPNKEIDLCALCMILKEKNMLPALIFHLNAFESIALFKQLLASIELRQKAATPDYYTKLSAEKKAKKDAYERQQKNTGGNEKEAEQLRQAGEMETEGDFQVDIYEPDPKYRFSTGSVMLSEEFLQLSDDMESFDGFVRRDGDTRKTLFGMNESVLTHALMRGLRRGIGLYIDEVSFPSYRRAVQKLASLGKLAVVISDDSLAFGVNMPFRTCIFCGEMEGLLTPLMAQQMSGRAGRRGLDTQGNLVYAGARASFIRSLMIGHVANITGADLPPKYETLFLQAMLSTRHVGWSRAEVLGGRSLLEYSEGYHLNTSSSQSDNYVLNHSKQVLEDLDFITIDAERGGYVPSEEWQLLSMIWELRNHVEESITLGRLLPKLMESIARKKREIMTNASGNSGDYSADRKREKENDAKFVPFFYSILLQLIDRTPHDPTKTSLPPLHEHPLFNESHPVERAVFFEWSEIFAKDQASYPNHLNHLKSKVAPGVPLDSTLFQCILDREYVHTLSEMQKQNIKWRLWHVGTTVKTMHNNIWPHIEYANNMATCMRTCFRSLFYLNSELIRAQINFTDISAAVLEVRADHEVTEWKGDPCCQPWKDTYIQDNENNTHIVTFHDAFSHVLSRMSSWKSSHPNATPKQLAEQYEKHIQIFTILKTDKDMSLLRLCVDFKEADVPTILATCSPSQVSKGHIIGTLYWLCHEILPIQSKFFLKHLQNIYYCEAMDILEDNDIKAWLADSAEKNIHTLPSGTHTTVEELTKFKSSAGVKAFATWLESQADEEDEDDEDEEEED